MFSLQGCMNVAMTGAQVVYDRHNLQKKLTDQYISLQANRDVNGDKTRFKDTNIAIATFNRIVLLTGQVPEAWQRTKAQKIVEQIPNVKKVYNFITISKPSSALTQMSDAWITAKIKSKFIASNEIDPSQIKVVTENGTVYLMGIVLCSQAKAAIYLARTTDGVQNVVKILSYMKIYKEM